LSIKKRFSTTPEFKEADSIVSAATAKLARALGVSVSPEESLPAARGLAKILDPNNLALEAAQTRLLTAALSAARKRKFADAVAYLDALLEFRESPRTKAVRASAKRSLAQLKQGLELMEREASKKADVICSRFGHGLTKQECRGLVDTRKECTYQIGDKVGLVFFNCGMPDAHNESNYGRGLQHQYCWRERHSFCIYDKNDDDVVDAFN
jgi:hypothetical protein